MIKMTATLDDGTNILILGLSHRNLDRLRADGTSFIAIKGEEVGIPKLAVYITAGETEEALQSELLALFPLKKPEG